MFLDPQGKVITQSNEVLVSMPHRAVDALPNGHRILHVMWRTRFNLHGDHAVVIEHRDSGHGEWERVAVRCLTVLATRHPLFPAIDGDHSQPELPGLTKRG